MRCKLHECTPTDNRMDEAYPKMEKQYGNAVWKYRIASRNKTIASIARAVGCMMQRQGFNPMLNSQE